MMAQGSENDDVAALIAGIRYEGRRQNARDLLDLMRAVTNEEPRLWGTMIGFGTYHYRYASGREGDWFKVGFAPRTSNLTVYLLSGMVGYGDLLAKLGPHKTGKSCIYIKRLADIDRDILAELVRRSVAHIDQVEADAGGVPRMSDMPEYRD